MNWLTQTIGIGLIIIAAIDIFITVLYPRTGNSIVSLPLGRGIWHIFRWLARSMNSDRLMAYCGSEFFFGVSPSNELSAYYC